MDSCTDLDGKVSACEEKWLADHGCYEREQKELNDLSSECKRVTEALTTIRQQNEQLRENLMQTCQLVDQLATDQRAMQEQLDHDRFSFYSSFSKFAQLSGENLHKI